MTMDDSTHKAFMAFACEVCDVVTEADEAHGTVSLPVDADARRAKLEAIERTHAAFIHEVHRQRYENNDSLPALRSP